MTRHAGGCHCGQVRFEVEAPTDIEAVRCNCSICRKSGYLHLIVPKEDFDLRQGDDILTTYTFNTGVARHLFCSVCGVKSFYVPRSHPEGISVNVNCLDEESIESIRISQFDGRHWEESISELSHISD